MVFNKSTFIVLIFPLLLSFGLICSSACAHGRRTEPDARQQYEQCQGQCQWETRGEKEQEQCEQSCERKYKEQQQGQQEERGRRSHDINPEDPQKKYEECQQRCEQQEYRQRPQCQLRCQRQLEEQQRQQQQCQERCERQEQEQQEQQQCQRKCRKQSEEQRRQQQCQEHCEMQEQGRQEQQQCQRKCLQKSEEQQREQKEQPQTQYQECQERCQEHQQGQEKQQQCQRKCREQYKEQERDKDDDNHHHKQSRREGEEQEEEEEEEQQRDNPYYFPYSRSFQTRLGDEEGKYKVLQRFAEKSPLLKAIKDYSLAMLEANPNTVVLPFHIDSETIYFVTNGRGIITVVTHERKESYNIECGTAVRIPAGNTVYMVNQDNKEKLSMAVLGLPVNAPGKSQAFFPAGNGNAQSYYQIFSSEILQTVLNTRREKLEQLFEGQQTQKKEKGGFRRAKTEQITAMSQQATSPRQRGGEILSINLLSQSPVYSNQNGHFFEASPEEFKQLQDMDVAVAAFKMNQEAIFVPHYNSKATFVVLVTEGNGYIEMICPHLARQSQGSLRERQDRREQQEEEEEEEVRIVEYKKVKARLSPGDVFVIPAGHPFTFVASKNENLKTIGFGIHAQNNQRIFLAGKKNLMRQMDSEAKEISFGVPSKLVDEIFNKQEESYFMSFSQQKQRESEERRGNPLASFLDFARLF